MTLIRESKTLFRYSDCVPNYEDYSQMNEFIQYYKKVEYFFGNLKFAVVIITLFALGLAIGTIVESFHGAEYANRIVYKSIPFVAIQICMFLSILFATLIRLPPKKRLYGFYTIHSGLLILFIGAFITLKAGVDGSIVLYPNMASNVFQINHEQLTIRPSVRESEKVITVNLPYTGRERELDLSIGEIKIKTFLPFADYEIGWHTKPDKSKQPSTKYHIYNDNLFEEFILTQSPHSNLKNTIQLGPLNIHYMPESIYECFKKAGPYIVWNRNTGNCTTPSEVESIERSFASEGIKRIKFDGQYHFFRPEMAPFELNDDFKFDRLSPVRVFNKDLFINTPHIFLFGQSLAYYDDNRKVWEYKSFASNEEASLPWMNLNLRAVKHTRDLFPYKSIHYTKPIQESTRLIKGDIQAVKVQVQGDSFWVDSTRPLEYQHANGNLMKFELGRKSLQLPYQITLDRFQMDYDRGTTNPATYESFVTLFEGNEGTSRHHIYMNAPLKKDDFTFYQASYFEVSPGQYGSVLSVNFDPGRPFKYVGSFMLIIGSIWHFSLRRKSIAKPNTSLPSSKT